MRLAIPPMLINAFAFLHRGGKGVAHGATEGSCGFDHGVVTALAARFIQLIDVN